MSSHLQVALDERGHIEQERGERVREAGGGRRVGRDRRLRRSELELPARPAVVLRLQQEVARVPEVLAELDRVVPATLVNTVANWTVRSERSHGRLPEKPTSGMLKLRLVPKSIRVMPLVHSSMFAPRIPTSSAVFSPLPAGERLVVEIVQAAARLHDERDCSTTACS